MDPDQALITRYLLDLLPPEESDSVEQRYFSDAAFFEKVQAIEDELIRDYVCGDLTGRERADFEKKYLQTPALLEKVDLAQALRSQEVGSMPVAASPALTLSDRLARILHLRPPTMKFVWVFAAVIIAAGLWVAKDRISRGGPGGVSETAHGSQSGTPLLSAFLIAPGTSRGLPETQSLLQIPGNVQTVRLDLTLTVAVQYSEYRAELLVLGADGMHSIFASDHLHPENTNAGRVLRLEPDAALLKSGDYVVRVGGRTTDGSFESLPSYSFRIQRSQ